MSGKVAIYVHVANMCWWTNQCACGEPGCSEWRRRSTPPGGPQPPTDSKVPTHTLPVLLVEHVSQNVRNGVCLNKGDLNGQTGRQLPVS